MWRWRVPAGGGALRSAEVSRSAPLPVGVDHISVDDVFVDYAGTLALLGGFFVVAHHVFERITEVQTHGIRAALPACFVNESGGIELQTAAVVQHGVRVFPAEIGEELDNLTVCFFGGGFFSLTGSRYAVDERDYSLVREVELAVAGEKLSGKLLVLRVGVFRVAAIGGEVDEVHADMHLAVAVEIGAVALEGYLDVVGLGVDAAGASR